MVKGCVVGDCPYTGIYVHGTASDNVVDNCRFGIGSSNGDALINGNKITNCVYGIYAGSGSIIGNTVINGGTSLVGVSITTNEPALVTQNTVNPAQGGITFHGGAGTVNVSNTNAGF